MIELIPIGARVTMSGVDGVITAAMIESNQAVSYRVAWFDGRQRYCEWVTAKEVSTTERMKHKIGFTTDH